MNVVQGVFIIAITLFFLFVAALIATAIITSRDHKPEREDGVLFPGVVVTKTSETYPTQEDIDAYEYSDILQKERDAKESETERRTREYDEARDDDNDQLY